MTESEELAERLCVAAGMMMEDVLDTAILCDGPGLFDRAAKIGAAGRDILALADAAHVLLRRSKPQDDGR